MTRWNKRIRKLQRRQRRDGGVLIMPGGLVTVIQMSDGLGLVLAAMRRQHSRISGTPTPASKFDRTLDLLERATDIGLESSPLLRLAWEIADASQGYIPDVDDFDSNSTTIN